MFPHFESQTTLSDAGKTKEQLIRELADMRSRLVELETNHAQLSLRNVDLPQNHDLFQKIINTLPQILYIVDLSQRNVLYINTQITKILGYDLQEIYQEGLAWVANHIHPDDRYLLHDFSRRFLALTEPEILSSEYRLRHKHGEWRWMSSREMILSRHADGTPLQVLGCVIDITEQKQVEATLRQKTAQLKEAQYLAHVGNWEFDRATSRMEWSEETFRIFGLDSAQPEPTYREFLQWIHPHDVSTFEQFLAQAVQDGIFRETEYRLLRPNGSIRHINLTVEGIFDYEGQVIGLFGVITDVTEHRRLEQLLRSQAEHQRLLGLVTQRIHQSLDLDEILTTAVSEVRRTLHVDRVLIFRFHPTGTGAIIKQAVLPPYPMAVETFGVDECQLFKLPNFYSDTQPFLQRSQHQSQVIHAVDQDSWASRLAVLMQDEAVQSEVIVPIIQNDHGSISIWGLLIVHACSQPRQWQPAEVELLEHMSEQLAIAIQQSELYQQVQHFNLNLEHQVQQHTVELQSALYFEAVLKRITDAVRDSLDETQILQTAVEELAFALRVTHCDTALYSTDKQTSTIFYDCTSSAASAQQQVIQTSDFPDVYQRLFEGEYVYFSLLMNQTNPIYVDAPHSTILACPILNGQQVLGDLWLRKAPGEMFDEQEIRLVQQVANQCAIALRQSRLYQASQAQVQELEEVNRLKDDFLSTISHELRTPLTNMKMATQMMELLLTQQGIFQPPLDAADKDTALTMVSPNPIERYFQILKTECQREISLVNDLLELNRLESVTEMLHLTDIELPTVISQIVNQFASRIQAQQQRLTVEIAHPLPALKTDLSCMERILTELLNNACKYTASQEAIAIAAQFDASRSFIWLHVSNSGIEIPESERDRIFERFYRIPSHDPWRHGGTGLGLALVKKLVERIGATIQVTSAACKTTFTLMLPISSGTSERPLGR